MQLKTSLTNQIWSTPAPLYFLVSAFQGEAKRQEQKQKQRKQNGLKNQMTARELEARRASPV